MIDVRSAVACTRILVAISISIGAAEYLAISSQFAGFGIFSDRVYRLNWIHGPRVLVGFYRTIFSYRAVRVRHAIHLGLALLLFMNLGLRFYSLILAILFFNQLITSFNQTGLGHDGSDHMLLVVTPALSVAYAFRLKGPEAWIALSFIVAQSALAYATSGISKLISPVWRSGRSLPLIFNTAGYGSSHVSALLARVPAFAIIGSWTVIVFECTMPLVLIAPRGIMISMLLFACLFHLGCALAMGLNCFFWSFASTFPLLYLCNVDRIYVVSELELGDKIGLLAGCAFALVVVGAVLGRYYDIVFYLRKVTSVLRNSAVRGFRN